MVELISGIIQIRLFNVSLSFRIMYYEINSNLAPSKNAMPLIQLSEPFTSQVEYTHLIQC